MNGDMSRRAILCRIAHITSKTLWVALNIRYLADDYGSEQFGPALLGGRGDDCRRDEHFFSYLRSPEQSVDLKLLFSFRLNSGGCLILPNFDVRKEGTSPAPTYALKIHTSGQSASDTCARIRDLGFKASTHIKMYGEHFELVSDPFVEGDYTAVHAISRDDRGIRALRLPVSILVGLPDLFRRKVNLAENTPLACCA